MRSVGADFYDFMKHPIGVIDGNISFSGYEDTSCR